MKNKIILILVLVSFLGFGQKIKYIETKTKNYGSYISQVQFIDTITGNIIKTIDVEKDNPFYKILPKPDSIFTGPSVTRFYEYNNISLNSIISQNIINEYVLNDTINYDIKIKTIDVSKGNIYMKKNKDYCLIHYYIFICSEYGPVFSQTIVQMYNNKGDIIFNKKWNNSTFYFEYSVDNKFLCYTVIEEKIEKLNCKYYIYDINNKKQKYQGPLLNIKGNVGIERINNKIVFIGFENKIIFDSKKMLIYKYKFENGEFVNIGNIKKFSLR